MAVAAAAASTEARSSSAAEDTEARSSTAAAAGRHGSKEQQWLAWKPGAFFGGGRHGSKKQEAAAEIQLPNYRQSMLQLFYYLLPNAYASYESATS